MSVCVCVCLCVSSGVISGAKTTDYLLEKSRVCTQAEDERNYHCFYEMCVGLPEEERMKYGLANPDDYFYLNQVGGSFFTAHLNCVSVAVAAV